MAAIKYVIEHGAEDEMGDWYPHPEKPKEEYPAYEKAVQAIRKLPFLSARIMVHRPGQLPYQAPYVW